ncbi:MAG: hypothetical protein JKX92_10490 [Porticoccaceae bacterium]|nr:hypothetical protein [Porticoccaceae bacterium]
MKKIVLTLLIIASVSSCGVVRVDSYVPELTPKQVERRDLMIGVWYGDQPTKQGGRKRWVETRRSDGTYKIEFQIVSASGERDNSQEYGEWGVSGPVYFSITRGSVRDGVVDIAKGTDPFTYTAYKLITLDGASIQYESFKSGNRYKVVKVSSGFTILN